MRLYTIERNGCQEVAVECGNGKLRPVQTFGYNVKSMNELIDTINRQSLDTLKEAIQASEIPGPAFDMNTVRVCAPIPEPKQDVICLGVNYMEHIQETVHVEDFQHKEATVYFSKRCGCVSGSEDEIPNYAFVDSLDYEAELGVVLGTTVLRGDCVESDDCIFGFTVINDVSARNLQFKHKQWYMGKSLDGYTIMGPCIVTPDEIGNVQNLAISCRVNGELRQNSSTRCMIQSVLGAIRELAQGMTLKAGTVIATGTPGGVGLGMNPPCYLKEGDVVECEIEKIGRIVNRVGRLIS